MIPVNLSIAKNETAGSGWKERDLIKTERQSEGARKGRKILNVSWWMRYFFLLLLFLIKELNSSRRGKVRTIKRSPFTDKNAFPSQNVRKYRVLNINQRDNASWAGKSSDHRALCQKPFQRAFREITGGRGSCVRHSAQPLPWMFGRENMYN